MLKIYTGQLQKITGEKLASSPNKDFSVDLSFSNLKEQMTKFEWKGLLLFHISLLLFTFLSGAYIFLSFLAGIC